MKKIVSLAFAAILTFSLLACAPEVPVETSGATTAPAETTAPEAVFMAGFGKADITPEEFGVPMQGYSNNANRLSTGLYSYLYATALAVRDQEGNTALILSVDSAALGEGLCDDIHYEIERKTGIPAENMFNTSIHQHSAPCHASSSFETSRNYRALLIKRTVQAAVDAVADLAPAQMYGAVVKTEDLNFHSHYRIADGTVAGDNFGNYSAGIAGYVRTPDPDLQLVKFQREGCKDILLAHYQGHPSAGTSAWNTNISADVPGVFRETVENSMDCHVIYVSGAQADVAMISKIPEDEVYKDYKEKGQRLAQYAMDAEGDYVPLQTGKVQVSTVIFDGKVNHTTDDLWEEATAIDQEWAKNNNTALAMAHSTSGKIRSVYHARAILNRCADGPTLPIELMAVSFGDVALCGGPYEMFDENGQQIKVSSPFAFTMPAHMVNGTIGYIPSQAAYDYSCYQSDISRYVPGTGEQCRDEYLKMLQAQHDAQ